MSALNWVEKDKVLNLSHAGEKDVGGMHDEEYWEQLYVIHGGA